MKLSDLQSKLSMQGLELRIYEDGVFVVGKRGVANPLLFFKGNEDSKDYNGSVVVKSINVPIYTKEQVYHALRLVDSFLQTPLQKRGDQIVQEKQEV